MTCLIPHTALTPYLIACMRAVLGSVRHWAGCAILGSVRLGSMLGRSNGHGLCAVLSVLERIVKYRALFDIRN